MFTKVVCYLMTFTLAFALTINSAGAQSSDGDGRFNVAATGDSQYVGLIGRALVEGPFHDVFVEGSYAYICASCAFVILDVSEPTQPVKSGHLVLPDIANDVYISGNYAYVADGYSGLRIIDISDKQNPSEVGYYDTPGNARGVYVYNA